jgi:hypothetical protein
MAEVIVMEKDAGKMNVPASKLQEYLDAGWKEISRTATEEPESSPVSEPKLEPKKTGKK